MLINSHCPIISVESSEEHRFAVLLRCVVADIWRAVVPVECNRGIVARRWHGAVQLRSAGTGAGEHGDDAGRCRLSAEGFSALLLERQDQPAFARSGGRISHRATIDCVVGDNNRVADGASRDPLSRGRNRLLQLRVYWELVGLVVASAVFLVVSRKQIDKKSRRVWCEHLQAFGGQLIWPGPR